MTRSGCGYDKEEKTKTVDWYKANKAEREEKLAECSNNPGELRKTPNCVNAAIAARQNFSRPSTYLLGKGNTKLQ
ncbi:EexN family lipoprotein [Candidatus Vondammii sp. HM_W22]|uniref:EexN family lipoprotein n=1 Tax=Candidatus Vondammii sp. HM_W22 TaxID=2687299 RepID=UPI002E7C3B0A|nr:EexN family lipoprotein [Candidatus Vondammii sp. HM_W22]